MASPDPANSRPLSPATLLKASPSVSPKLQAISPTAASAAPLPRPSSSASIWLRAVLSTIAGTAALPDFFPATESISQWTSSMRASAASGHPSMPVPSIPLALACFLALGIARAFSAESML
ncbi:MAG: hypothetical protein LBU32_20040 [Clostridiales bacterium]|nr:hypothetical protein [Clostridiales bacterium]